MKSRCLLLLCLIAMTAYPLRQARACPYCRADAAGLAGAAPAASGETFALLFSGGIDFPTAFYFRGYLQADEGLIVQPYLNLFTAFTHDEVVVRPYVSLFHSAHPDSDNRMADMSDVMIGAVATGHALAIDARYAFYTMNQLMRSNVHELGVKASYDVLARCRAPGAASPFALRPFAGIYFDLFDEEGTEDVFVNVGLEPSWKLELAGHKIGLGLPIDWGLSADDYYLDRDGSNAALGYFSTSLTASVVLPARAGRGQWFLNGSLQYLHLAADSVRVISDEDDICIGKIGVSFVH
jgi:hypothetical protein